jgi:signal transduction histidine kinase
VFTSSKSFLLGLLNILLNNLLINAINYNLEKGGTIKVELNENYFSIENTSNQKKIDKQFIFERFTK